MKTMRKLIIAVLTVAVVATAAVLPAVAEASPDANSAATPSVRGRYNGGWMNGGYQMNGNGYKNGNNQMPGNGRMNGG